LPLHQHRNYCLDAPDYRVDRFDDGRTVDSEQGDRSVGSPAFIAEGVARANASAQGAKSGRIISSSSFA
jgi:hypothetical protein